MSVRALQVNGSDSGQGLCLVAGLFHADEPVGVLACTWTGAEDNALAHPAPSDAGSLRGASKRVEAGSSDLREWLVVCLANYLGQVFGGQSTHSPETDVYLAGTGLLLTALEVGPPAARACAEAVTCSALEMAAANDLRPAEIQSLQWAALFHEVGRAPMDRWLTFPAPNGRTGQTNEVGSAEPEPADQPCLALIPNLQSAARLLTQVTPVLDDQDGNPDSDVYLPARLLAQACLSSHCGR